MSGDKVVTWADIVKGNKAGPYKDEGLYRVLNEDQDKVRNIIDKKK